MGAQDFFQGLYWGYIGIVEKQMETTCSGLGFRVKMQALMSLAFDAEARTEGSQGRRKVEKRGARMVQIKNPACMTLSTLYLAK